MTSSFEDYHPIAKDNLIMEKETSTHVDVTPLSVMIMYLLATL